MYGPGQLILLAEIIIERDSLIFRFVKSADCNELTV